MTNDLLHPEKRNHGNYSNHPTGPKGPRQPKPKPETGPRTRARVRQCTVCRCDLATANYYSFDGHQLWCLPCGRDELAQMRALKVDPPTVPAIARLVGRFRE